MEFKQNQTKAALWLIDELREMRDNANHLANRCFGEVNKMRKENAKENAVNEKEQIAIHSAMESEVYQHGMDELRKQVEEQNFDY